MIRYIDIDLDIDYIYYRYRLLYIQAIIFIQKNISVLL